MDVEPAGASTSPNLETMPGHWLLARMGKRVLRPGGIELTAAMLDGLDISSDDAVVELAPGLGTTAVLALARSPRSYIGVEQDTDAARRVKEKLRGANDRCVVGTAAETHLPTASATVVYGEAMLTMQTRRAKRAIVAEAFRLLEPRGRYGIHELCLRPDAIADDTKKAISRDLSKAIRVNARPLTVSEWVELLTEAGFEVTTKETDSMRLLDPGRVIRDEGLRGALRVAFNVARTPVARRRVLAMRRVFHTYEDSLAAVALVARKPGEER